MVRLEGQTQAMNCSESFKLVESSRDPMNSIFSVDFPLFKISPDELMSFSMN